VVVLYTREAPPQSPRPSRRIDAEDLRIHGLPADVRPTCYVCGPTPFVESVTQMLIDAGHDATRVRAERFGATGG
jgi:ferredoxin-NADP reductase